MQTQKKGSREDKQEMMSVRKREGEDNNPMPINAASGGTKGQRSNARVNKVLTDFAGSAIRASVASFLEGHFETC